MYDITPDIREEENPEEAYKKWEREQARPEVLSPEETEDFFRDVPF